MHRLVVLLTFAGLAAAPAPAIGQEPPPAPPLAEEIDPEPTAEPAPEPAPDPERDPCEGADADYQYAYCDAVPVSQPGGGDDAGRGGGPQAQPLPAGTLALTGAETRFLVVAGLGLLFAGIGLRVRLGASRT